MKTRDITGVIVALAMAGLTGCYSKYMVFQADVVSMTKTNAGDVRSLKEGPEVSETWCMGDEPVAPNADGSKEYGLADQVILKAQDNGRKADFITNAVVYRDSRGCALLTGKAAKL